MSKRFTVTRKSFKASDFRTTKLSRVQGGVAFTAYEPFDVESTKDDEHSSLDVFGVTDVRALQWLGEDGQRCLIVKAVGRDGARVEINLYGVDIDTLRLALGQAWVYGRGAQEVEVSA